MKIKVTGGVKPTQMLRRRVGGVHARKQTSGEEDYGTKRRRERERDRQREREKKTPTRTCVCVCVCVFV